MAKQSISIGSIANDGTGSNLRDGGDIINDNFNELYTAIGDGSVIDQGRLYNIVGGTGIGTNLVGNDLTLTADVSADSTATLTNKTIDIASNTIQNANLLPAISIADNSSTVTQIALGETLGIIGGGGIETTVAGDSISIAITGITNTELDANAGILNTQLANDYVTLGYTNVALGSSATTVSGLSITGFAQFVTTAENSAIRFNHNDFASFPVYGSYAGTPALDETTGKAFIATTAGYKELISLDDLSPETGDTLFYNGTIWAQAQTPISQLSVTSSGTGYTFIGAGFATTSGDNPDLHLKKGHTYYFVNNSGGGHPFRVQSTSGTSGTVYNDGVTNNAGATGAIIFHVQMDAPATLYYQCTAHAGLNGTISIT